MPSTRPGASKASALRRRSHGDRPRRATPTGTRTVGSTPTSPSPWTPGPAHALARLRRRAVPSIQLLAARLRFLPDAPATPWPAALLAPRRHRRDRGRHGRHHRGRFGRGRRVSRVRHPGRHGGSQRRHGRRARLRLRRGGAGGAGGGGRRGGGGGGAGDCSGEEAQEEEAGGQVRRAAHQVGVQGGGMPRRSMESRLPRPDHRHEPEHRDVLGAHQGRVRRAQARRPLLQRRLHAARVEGDGEPLGAYPGGVQQMAWDRRGGRGSPGERRQR